MVHRPLALLGFMKALCYPADGEPDSAHVSAAQQIGRIMHLQVDAAPTYEAEVRHGMCTSAYCDLLSCHKRLANGWGNLGAKQLYGPHDVGVRHWANTHLGKKAFVSEQFMLEENLLYDL